MTENSLISDLIDRLDAERRNDFEERAGAIQIDGQQPRDQAELLALVDLLRAHPAALVGLTALMVKVRGLTEIILTTDLHAAYDRFVVVDTVDLSDFVRRQFGGVAVLRRFQHLI